MTYPLHLAPYSRPLANLPSGVLTMIYNSYFFPCITLVPLRVGLSESGSDANSIATFLNVKTQKKKKVKYTRVDGGDLTGGTRTAVL